MAKNKDIEPQNKLVIFQSKEIRRLWYENEWVFSVIDIVAALTDSTNPRDYWYKMKIRVKEEDGFEPSTVCRQLKMEAPDGKKRLTDCANTEGVLRIIQSIPSPKATFGMTPSKYKNIKNLPKKSKANLRDHMDDLELIFTMLGERMTTEISKEEVPDTFDENKDVAKRGGKVAGNARKDAEKELGRSVISKKNYLDKDDKKKLE